MSPLNCLTLRGWAAYGGTVIVLLLGLFPSLPAAQSNEAGDFVNLGPIRKAVPVGLEEADAHLSGLPYARIGSSHPTSQELRYGLRFRVVVDKTGQVTSLHGECDGNVDSEVIHRALAAARELKYQPFERDGHPVSAEFEQRIDLLPAELPVYQHIEFPVVKDWNSVRISLLRTRCYGTCPAYRVQIFGDGTVIYEGEKFVTQIGKRTAKIPKESVERLVASFRDADFYSLHNEYKQSASDIPTFEVSIEIDGLNKKVKDYNGLFVGMPFSVVKLEQLTDEVGNTKQWTGVAKSGR